MWKMIIGQSIFQLAATFTLYFAGGSLLNYNTDDPKVRLQLDTLIFNTFVWMQIFNEFNSRRLDNKLNIFEGIHRNYFFILINILMVGLQVAIIFVGGSPFAISPRGLTGDQWAISVLVACICLPWAVLVRMFRDEWFGAAAGVLGNPFVAVYRASGRVWARLVGGLKRSKRGDEAEREEGRVEGDAPGPRINAPAIVVDEPLPAVVEPTHVERGHSP